MGKGGYSRNISNDDKLKSFSAKKTQLLQSKCEIKLKSKPAKNELYIRML